MEFFEQKASAPNLEMLISHGAELSAKVGWIDVGWIDVGWIDVGWMHVGRMDVGWIDVG